MLRLFLLYTFTELLKNLNGKKIDYRLFRSWGNWRTVVDKCEFAAGNVC